MFKVGDVVKCVREELSYLELGKHYTVVTVCYSEFSNVNHVYVQGSTIGWYLNRFVLVAEKKKKTRNLPSWW
jgi:hypothetical protein